MYQKSVCTTVSMLHLLGNIQFWRLWRVCIILFLNSKHCQKSLFFAETDLNKISNITFWKKRARRKNRFSVSWDNHTRYLNFKFEGCKPSGRGIFNYQKRHFWPKIAFFCQKSALWKTPISQKLKIAEQNG